MITNPKQTAMGNCSLPTVSDNPNITASVHNRKLIAALAMELNKKVRIYKNSISYQT
ncbi:MAG TPA: hypothetical protein VE619_06380 [Nitrososphaeraceae archaeon]|nr:hypothetical protein [Nitrososphaeraceae archaeon]